ncbi:MAG: adenosylcobinamide-GDP ribazoletransferase [Acidimicrobiales bacterium]
MRAAFAFLTPLGPARAPSPAAVSWFPLVGAALGGVLGVVWWACGQVLPSMVAGAVVVAADLALTGMLHFDGLVDAADGLLPHLSRQRRLDVMRSPEAGAFGVAAGATALLVRWAALASLRPAPLLLAGLWCLSRAGMGVVMRVVPYARAGSGLADAFGGQASLVPIGSGVAAAVAILWLWRAPAGPTAAAGAALAGGAVVLLAWRRVGGFTGDVLGAAAVVAETAGLVVASARW